MPPKGWKKKAEDQEPKQTIEPEQPDKRLEREAPPPPPVPIEAKIKEDSLLIDSILPKKDNYRVDEVAMHFDVSAGTIRLWIQNGHLSGVRIGGILRVPRRSIIECKFNNRTDKL